MMTLSKKRILITGASSGIGRATAVLCAELGASVILTARRQQELERTLAEMRDRKSHSIVAGDVTDGEFIEKLVSSMGKIDGFVHAAGIGQACPIGMIKNDYVERMIRTNYFSFLELMKYFSKSKYRADKLSIVAVSSVSSVVGWAGGAVYCGTKGALCASVRALAVELASKGVRVNAISPSNIKTPAFDRMVSEFGVDKVASLEAAQPLGFGAPEQVASAICFLLSDAASFITGVNLPVDGGFVAK